MEKQLGLGTGRLEEKETRTNVEDTTSVGLFCYVLRTSFLLSTLSLVCTGEGAGGGSWAHSSYCVHHDYHPLKDTWGLKSAPLWTEVAKVMELEVIACCFSVPTVANHSQLQPAEKDCLYTMHRFMKVFADRILLIIMTMKRITLFWMCLAIFFIWWMNGQHYTLCNVLIKNK